MMVALTLVVGSTLTSVSQLPVQQSTDAQPIRVVSVTSGTQGEARNGRYFILDPRATFHVPEDQKIIVSFQWLGIPGKHQMTGTWKGPGISTTNGFDYVAQGREFGAYWTLPLTAEAPEGSWTFEAQVDGQPAGTYTFEVRHGAGDPLVPSAPKTPGPVPMTRQEMFAKALGATVSVESLDATGRQIARGPGTLMDSNTIATSFSVINAASKLRVRVGKNTPIDLDSVLTWDRRRDWATLRISGPADISAPALVPSRPSVGRYLRDGGRRRRWRVFGHRLRCRRAERLSGGGSALQSLSLQWSGDGWSAVSTISVACSASYPPASSREPANPPMSRQR